MFYKIRHTTRFDYSDPIRESVMELRMQPRSDASQRCREFGIELTPDARTQHYTDASGNIVHHFDIPSMHNHLKVVTTALVEILPDGKPLPAVTAAAWKELDALACSPEHWDWLQFSHFAEPTERLRSLAEELGVRRRDDPLTVLRDLNSALRKTIAYEKGATKVDSPIDHCLELRRGVCQDFSHVFIAMARGLGIPTRYVSGYLFHRENDPDGPAEDATHAWAESYVPGAGWVGFDPSNHSAAGTGHVRVAVGRDYGDVPPNKGVFKGDAKQSLTVHVDVTRV